jgi:hypothetical protein
MKTLTVALLVLLAAPAMAVDWTITIPEAVAPRVLDAVCGSLGYQDTVDGQPNPETKAQFVRRMLKQSIRDMVRDYEARQYELSGKATLDADVKNRKIAIESEISF